ncbi:MAG: TetR family transcriptional regulator [Clostridia bacterium]|nr:TetR family transcriptional regulator [Clostridia bacterium]
MSLNTKTALSQSLIKLLSETTLDKITISDITNDCGLNRQTFYYHFKDVYDLVEWTYRTAAENALSGGKASYGTWQEGYRALLECQLENRAFVMNTYNSISRETLEKSMSDGLENLLGKIVDELCEGKHVHETDRRIIERFYAFGFTGMTIDWLSNGMKPEPAEYVAQISNVLSGNIAASIDRCAAQMGAYNAE